MNRKQLIGYMLIAFIPAVACIAGLFMFDFWTMVAMLLGSTIICVWFVHLFLLQTPFNTLDYGNHYPVLDICGKGVIGVYKAVLNKNNAVFRTAEGKKSLLFNRNCLFTLLLPKKVAAKEDEAGLTINIPKDKYADTKFSFGGRATILYNSTLDTFLTKDALGKQENEFFVEHQLLSIAHKIDELGTQILPFTSYMIELLKKKESWLSQHGNVIKYVMIVIAIMIAIAVGLTIFGNPTTVTQAQTLVGGLSGPISPA